MTKALTTTSAVSALILLALNFTITSAQQQQEELPTSQSGEIGNGATATTAATFQSTEDSFRVQVPEGWVIHDVNNTGSTRSEESRQGYGILAQLCPQEEERQQAAALSNVSGRGNTARCQGTEEDIIHIIRYPDLETGLQAANNISTTNNNNMTIDNILLYHLQKLGQVGLEELRL